MVRHITPWGHTNKSWNVNEVVDLPKSSGTSGYTRLKLLIWKNYKLQTRNKVQTLVELLLPLLFIAILVVIRVILPSTHIDEPTIFKPLEIDGLPPYILREKCDHIYYTPANAAVNALIDRVKSDYFDAVGLKYNFVGFNTEDELLKAYDEAKHDNNSIGDEFEASSPVLAGIVFENEFTNSSFSKDIQYKLRFPASQRSEFDAISEKFGLKAAWFTELIFPLFQLLGPRAKESIGGGLPGYHEEGFLYLQYAIERSLIRMLIKDKETEYDNKYDIKLQRFPYPSYIDDKYLFGLQAFLPLLLILSMIFPVLNITKCIVHEKEKRLKESMKMMGLSNWIHWTAWIFKSQVVLTFSSIIIAILLKARFVESQSLAVIPETNIFVLIFIFFIYSFSAVCYSCLVSTLFSRANTAALAAGAFWFFLHVPYCFIQPRYNTLSRNFKFFTGIFTNNPIGYISQIICNFEGIGVGIQWSNLATGSTPDDNFCMADCLTLLAINSVIFLLLAFYIEAVWPGEYGIPLPWNFFLKKWYWTGRFRHAPEYDFSKTETDPARSAYFEKDPPRKRPGVEIKNLTKKFGDKTAVNKMNLKLFEDQVTALLGHNGAGKSTTMSMLTGLFPPTSGTALVNGFDICSDITSVRNSLGICPQHDVLFDELTVEEHLRFFCELKGLDKMYVNAEVTRMIEALGLQDKRHAEARTLSGGMKRKLSVGVAFCGGSKVVLLDEPTSGMDPGARRSTWDLIQSEKKRRTVLLSTHFMEEADLLGDRIAIMSKGDLQCCGSSLFLKKKYGGGYHLVIVKAPGCIVENISNVLKTAIPEVEIDQDIGAELSYVLPDSKAHLFPTLFSELERKRKDLGIASYGASITTMENVFMRVIREHEEATVSNVADYNRETKVQVSTDPDCLKKYSNRNSGLFLMFQQIWAMLIKKLIFLVRNRMLVLASILLPMLYIVVVFLIMGAFPGFSNPRSMPVALSTYETVGKTTTLIHCPSHDDICNSYKALVSENYITVDVPEKETMIDHILEKASHDLAIVNFQYIVGLEERTPGSENFTGSGNKTELIGFFNNQPFHAPPLALNFISNAFLRQVNTTVKVTNHPFPYSRIDSLKEQGGILTIGFQVGYNCALAMSFLAAYFVLFPIRERMSGSKHLQYISGVKPIIFWSVSFVTDVVQYLISCVLIVLVLVLFKMEEFTHINMQLYFLLLTACFGVTVILLVYVLSFLFVIPTSGFAVLTVMGIFTGIAPMFAVSILQNPEFRLETLANELNKYLLIFPNYALGMGIVQLSTNYHLAKSCSQNFNLEFLCSAYPESVCCMQLRENYLDWERSGIGRNIIYLVAFAILYAILLILTELKFFHALGKCFTFSKSNDDDDGPEDDSIEDSDVVEERKRIQNGSLHTLCRSNNLIVRNLTKYYGNFLAVDDLNLGVKPGECFGLLGINGAGKTTTFKMLTGDYEPSAGDAFISGYSIRNQLKKAHQKLGYCPQFDALLGEMTGRETIKMFARLRGIREKDIDALVEDLSERLLFTPHIDKHVDAYSGGNKRKLSTAVALIGNPPIVFLDEPTTGMDPVARRHLWDAITYVRNQGTSIVLTSHSMEECEALCTRLVIMVNGKFRCLGSTQHLKTKFGKGYTIIAQTAAKISDPDQPFTRSQQEQGRRRSSNKSLKRTKSANENHWEGELQGLRSFIEERFPSCTLKDIHPCFVHYHIHPNENVSWGELFSAMEVAKLRFNLEAYSVGQTSLEQVFLNFTKSQINTG